MAKWRIEKRGWMWAAISPSRRSAVFFGSWENALAWVLEPIPESLRGRMISSMFRWERGGG